MLHLSRFGLGLLLLNLTLFGQELACAHEAETRALSASAHHGDSSPEQHAPAPGPDEQPCDETASRCCDAIPSCAITGIVGQGDGGYGPPPPAGAVINVARSHFANAPLEVATPPPRR